MSEDSVRSRNVFASAIKTRNASGNAWRYTLTRQWKTRSRNAWSLAQVSRSSVLLTATSLITLVLIPAMWIIALDVKLRKWHGLMENVWRSVREMTSAVASATSSTAHEWGTARIMIAAVIDARSPAKMQFVWRIVWRSGLHLKISKFEVTKSSQVS